MKSVFSDKKTTVFRAIITIALVIVLTILLSTEELHDLTTSLASTIFPKVDESYIRTLPAAHANRIIPHVMLRKLDESSEGVINSTILFDRGIAMCVGPKMVLDAYAVIDQLRSVHNSTLPIAIVHCEELSSLDHGFHNLENIVLFDVCQRNSLYEHNHNVKKRLRSWFCKAAAVISLPFKEVMVIDLDTIWMHNPDKVFHYPAYRKSGALYMRDRMTYDRGRGFHDSVVNFIQTNNPNISLSTEYAKTKVCDDGINFFWRGIEDPNLPTYNNFQESSMFIIHRTKHPKLLKTLESILPNFNLGWGDKEMYWMASIISEEPYTFEPFLFTLYGSCGAVMHYHPNDFQAPHKARPLYINGEWLVEKIASIGHDLDYTMPNSMLAAANTTMIDIKQSHGCACGVLGCRPIPYQVNQHILRAQWERKTRSIPHNAFDRTFLSSLQLPISSSPISHRPEALSYELLDPHTGNSQIWYVDSDLDGFLKLQEMLSSHLPCVLIYYPVAKEISDMNMWLQHRKECGKLGCAFAPIPLHANYSNEKFCLPVSFNTAGPEPELQHWTMILQIPPPRRDVADGTIIRGTGSRVVYLMVNQTLRAFPNGETFIHMGYEWEQVKVYHQREVDSWPKGHDLPAI